MCTHSKHFEILTSEQLIKIAVKQIVITGVIAALAHSTVPEFSLKE